MNICQSINLQVHGHEEKYFKNVNCDRSLLVHSNLRVEWDWKYCRPRNKRNIRKLLYSLLYYQINDKLIFAEFVCLPITLFEDKIYY